MNALDSLINAVTSDAFSENDGFSPTTPSPKKGMNNLDAFGTAPPQGNMNIFGELGYILQQQQQQTQAKSIPSASATTSFSTTDSLLPAPAPLASSHLHQHMHHSQSTPPVSSNETSMLSTNPRGESWALATTRNSLLDTVLRLPQQYDWVADWIFRVPVLSGSAPISPEMFGLAMVGEVEETFVQEYGVSNPVDGSGTQRKILKTMNVPSFSNGVITVGHTFCLTTEYECPLQKLNRTQGPGGRKLPLLHEEKEIMDEEDGMFFGRFVYDAKSNELMVACPHLEEGCYQMIWARSSPVLKDNSIVKKRLRAMLVVPGSVEYGRNYLPKNILMSTVYEEFYDSTFSPQWDFPDRYMGAKKGTALDGNGNEYALQRSGSPSRSSSPSLLSVDFDNWSTNPVSMATDVSMLDMLSSEKLPSSSSASLIPSADDPTFNLRSMTNAITEIELLFKGKYTSPMTLTDFYDIKSGQLLSRKTEKMITKMDRISNPDVDYQFRTRVAQTYYSTYYSPVVDLPLLPGAKDASTTVVNRSEVNQSSNTFMAAESDAVDALPFSAGTGGDICEDVISCCSGSSVAQALSVTPQSSNESLTESIDNVLGEGARTAQENIGANSKQNNAGGRKRRGRKAQATVGGLEKAIRKVTRLAPRPMLVPAPSNIAASGAVATQSEKDSKEEKAKRSKEAKAYAKKIRNRESAARSNARRRKHIAAVKKELETLNKEKEELFEKEKKMKEENAKMKANLVHIFSRESSTATTSSSAESVESANK